ncbi:putative multidrug resistance ABC transporter, ATP-binding/permease protein YheH [Peptoanaerobacter stomatis]|uniref:Putative multidrug resistance ABC transporter, ATP-binding/permease protein YheH n=1 Tax=Peptoanaerobacter stomatis TaxID=796937 RepID=J5W848_9FIRM|nr:ABC transporter ATP-binding protein [Peptoanaerobacter stomatis]EJU20062.1 putative multidrug resistance ABC transporter, ATP-binding/permease protein YheH [Peptoanaerobacter stomatis]NWO25027.1 ABC transporter ATP-binding protein [Peptostreptococcaceae bacterium oral taxon 081]
MNNNINQNPDAEKEDIKRLALYTLLFKSNFLKGLLFLLLAVVFELLAPFAVRKIFDEELKKAVIDKNSILYWIGLYLFVNITAMIFQYMSDIQLKIMAMRIVQKMRVQIYSNIQRIGISFFDNMPAGSIVSKVTNDTLAVQGLYVKVLGEIFKSTVYVISIYIILFTIQTQFALLATFLLPLVAFIIYIYNKKARVYNNVIRSKVSELNGAINETVQGISVIQAFNNQEQIQKDFDKTNEERVNQRTKLLVLNSATSYNIISTLRNIVFVVMIYYFGNKVIKDNAVTSVGLLYVYVDYISILFHHIHQIVQQMNEMSKSTVASSHVFEMIDKEGKDISDEKIEKINGTVEFKDISFYYKKDEYVLKNINISAEKGQTIALVGHTGSGKSSIMNLLLKFYQPKQGKILIDGMDLQTLEDQTIRDHMGIVLQEPYLFTGTILSNITLNKENISRQDAQKALEMVGGNLVLGNLKDGIDEKVVERGATLSSGQRQLISFARALAQNPTILILDEATSSVDSETEKIIQSAMDVLMKGRTTFIIAHRLSTIKNADKIYLLEKGRIIEQGTHSELLDKKGKYFDMYKTQSNL